MKRLALGSLIAVCSVLGILLLQTLHTNAANSNLISFQGKLTNPDGTNVTDGNYSIRFRIYTDPSADAANGCAANSCKWEETQATVAVSSGLFHVNLGSGTSLPGSVDFNATGLYLGVKVGSDLEMTPRVRLTAAAQAFNSDLLDGLDSTNFVQLAAGNINIGSGTLTSGAVNGITIGTTIQPSLAGALTIQSNSANALNLDTGGSAAINIGGSNSTSIIVGNSTTNPNISFNGSGTFGTPSGLVSLNGNTTITGTRTLTVNSGLTTLGGALTFSGTAARTITGPSTGGLSVTVAGGPLALSTTTSGGLSVTSAGALSLTGGTASTWDIGANTLSLQTTNNGGITTGTGTLTQGGNITFSGTAARSLTGPSTGGLSVTVASGPLTLSTTTSGAINITSAGALSMTGAAASTWDIGNNTLSLQTTNNGAITTGTGLLTQGGNMTFSGTTARTITGPVTGGLTINVTNGPLTLSTTTSGALTIQGSSGGVAITSGANITLGTSDTTGTLLIFDTKTGTGDPTGVNGGEYYNSANNKFRCYEGGVWKNCLGSPTNASTADQVIGASTTAYLNGSMITVPSSGLRAGTTFVWRITMSKTAAGTVANTFDVRVGTNGTTADTSRLAFAMGTQTAVADTAVVVITATVRSVSATGVMAGNYQMTHNLTNTGFDNALGIKTSNVTSGTHDNTSANLKVGLSITTGASYSLTFQQVQATSTGL